MMIVANNNGSAELISTRMLCYIGARSKAHFVQQLDNHKSLNSDPACARAG